MAVFRENCDSKNPSDRCLLLRDLIAPSHFTVSCWSYPGFVHAVGTYVLPNLPAYYRLQEKAVGFPGRDDLFSVPSQQWLKSHMLWPPRPRHVIIGLLTVLLNTKKNS